MATPAEWSQAVTQALNARNFDPAWWFQAFAAALEALDYADRAMAYATNPLSSQAQAYTDGAVNFPAIVGDPAIGQTTRANLRTLLQQYSYDASSGIGAGGADGPWPIDAWAAACLRAFGEANASTESVQIAQANVRQIPVDMKQNAVDLGNAAAAAAKTAVIGAGAGLGLLLLVVLVIVIARAK